MDEAAARSSPSSLRRRLSGARRAALLAAIAVLPPGCQDGRTVRLDEVTPQARSTITKIAGKDVITRIREEGASGRILYRVRIDRGGERKDYTVDDGGTMRD